MNDTWKHRASLSVSGGILIILIGFGLILVAALEKWVTVPEIIPAIGGWTISWPLVVFRTVFLNSPRAPSPQSPTPEAFLMMLLFDVILYSTVIYGVLSALARWKRRVERG
jgi:hypothetical protein